MALAEKAEQFALTAEEREQIAACLNPLETGMMGSIEIPKIDVNLPIYQGTRSSSSNPAVAGGRGPRCLLAVPGPTASSRLTLD